MATFTLRPGRAVYIPAGTPHWVHHGPNISQSVTFTYFTAATVRENRIEDFNSLPRRRFHMQPSEPGHSAVVDTVKVGAVGLSARDDVFGPSRSARSSGTAKPTADGAGYRVEGS